MGFLSNIFKKKSAPVEAPKVEETKAAPVVESKKVETII